MNEIDQAPSPDSKSVQKRAVEALQDLGARLIDCNKSTLEKCGLPADLLAALAEYKRLPNKHGALRRQLQFIGRLMRDLDDEALARIHAQLNRNVDLDKKKFAMLELRRDALLNGDKAALEELIEAHPQVNVQLLRQLIRGARKERDENQPPASARRLFRLLRALQEGSAGDAMNPDTDD
ncbi:MAG: ribosome biogenesis factor YjgA [Pseudohongiellaceae bacterium]|jgi:ribosome-associated protein